MSSPYYKNWNRTEEDGKKAERQMKRQISCKSNYKMHCFSCNKPINRGDLITHVSSFNGMELRWRGCDYIRDIDYGPCFYTPISGKNLWVHRDCVPCFYNKKSGEYENYWTDQSAYLYSLYQEHLDSYEDDETYHISYENWLKKTGRDKPKFMKDMLNK